MKESSKLKSLFAKDRGMPKGANYPAQFEKTAFEKGRKFRNLFKGLTVSGVASKFPKAAMYLGKRGSVARVARMATPIGLGASALKLAYDVATMSPEKKAKVKKLKTKLSKTSTKDYHADLLKMSVGGDTMGLKPIPPGKEKSLGKLPTKVRNKRGFEKDGGMMKAYKGDMAKGYGAARTQGQGLQDENLIPGKSLDYYKDIM